MPTVEELRSMYDQGEFTDCLKATQGELDTRAQDDPERGEFCALAGWCEYRKKEYQVARKWFLEAGSVSFAREGLAYLAAYVDKDDAALTELAYELGDRINIQNALTIRARATDSIITQEEVMEGVLRFNEDTVETANLYHNAGRVFFDIVRRPGKEDFVRALGLFDMARARYGIDRNWHHRGALNYWRARTLRALLDKRAALEAARDSLFCWTQQVIIDPGTERHKQQWENAVVLIRELTS